MKRLTVFLVFVGFLMLPAQALWAYYSDYSYGYASSSDSGPMISLSLDPQENLNNGFRLSVREDRLDEAESYLHEGAQVNSTSGDGRTALMIAARNCSQRLITGLLEAKADVNLQDKFGRTALMLAASDGCLTVVDQLASVAGVKVKLRDSQGKSAIDYAGPEFQIVDRLRQARHHASR